MIGFVAMLQAIVAAPDSPPPSGNDIVIVGRNIDSAQSSLAACMARACPPDQEIKAALVLATRQFLAGAYPQARRTLLRSRSRNAKFDTTYPMEVSDLHRALNRLSMLDGRTDSARMSMFDATDALRAGLPADDPLILLQRMDTANQLARESRVIGASEIYNDIAAKARQKGYFSVEAEALFRGAALYAALANVDPDYRPAARRWAARVERGKEPEFAEYRDGLVLLKAQIAALNTKRTGRGQGMDAALPAVKNAVLLHEPAIAFSVGSAGLDQKSGGNADPEWADVAFWIRPDGSVADVRLLAESRSRPGSWLPTKTRAVAARRYAPLKGLADPRGLYRVERYSMVYPMLSTTETRISIRSARGRLDTTDITAAHRTPLPDAG